MNSGIVWLSNSWQNAITQYARIVPTGKEEHFRKNKREGDCCSFGVI